MENKELILLRTLLKSTSRFNILKYEKDKKKRSAIIGAFVGLFFLYLTLMAFTILTGIGYGLIGLTNSIPVMCAFLIILLEFFFTIFETNGHLFAFKEYDMLMSLPFKTKSVVSCKFLYMYIKNLPFTVCISLSMMVVYGIFAKPDFFTYVIWIMLTLILPLIPMILASAVGSLIARIGSKSRHKSLVQTILTFIFVIFCFSLRYIIEAIIKKNQVNNILNTVSDAMNSVKKWLLSAAWFEDAVVSHSFLSIFLLIGCSILLYEIFFEIVGRNYREINSNLMSGAERKKYKMTRQKTRSIRQSVAFKEFKHFTGSTVYITNMGVGELLIVIICVLLIFVDMDQIIDVVTGNSPLTIDSLIPAIPLLVYFFIGMCSTTSASFSLEGRNYWIPQSLPISKKDLIMGKMYFNMYLTVPFTLLGTIALGIACDASFVQFLLMIICGIILCALSTTWGMRCDLKHYKHDWENEIEVIKKGSSVAWYMFPNMFGTMILVVILVFLGKTLGAVPAILINIVLAGLLTFLSYLGCMKQLKKI